MRLLWPGLCFLTHTRLVHAQSVENLGEDLGDVPDYNTYEGIFVEEKAETNANAEGVATLEDINNILSTVTVDESEDSHAYDIEKEVTLANFNARGRSSGSRRLNPTQIKYLSAAAKLKLSNEEQVEVRKQVLTCLASTSMSADRVLQESTVSHKWAENHKHGYDYAVLFMAPDTKLTREDNEDVLSVPKEKPFLRHFANAPITKAFYDIYECCQDHHCKSDILHTAPMPDADKIRNSVSFVLSQDDSMSTCTQGSGKLTCQSGGYTKQQDSLQERMWFQKEYDLVTVPTEEEYSRYKSGLATRSGGLRRAKQGSKRPPRRSKKKSKKPRPSKSSKKPSSGTKKSPKKKSPKKKKKRTKKPAPKWVPSADGKVVCRGWKCIPNPNYDASKDVEIAKGPGDLTDQLGKITIIALIQHLADTHGIDSLNSFKELVLDGNWIQGETSYLKDLFCMVPNLEKISFRATNILGKIQPDTFECLGNLKFLDFAENGLFCMENALDHLFDKHQIEYLGFDSNPMQSRCFFKSKEKARRKYVSIADKFDFPAMEKKKMTDQIEFNKVMKECLNTEPNCITNYPGLDPDLFS